MGCKDGVLTKPLLKNLTVNCFTFEEKARPMYNDTFRALSVPLHRKKTTTGRKKLQISNYK